MRYHETGDEQEWKCEASDERDDSNDEQRITVGCNVIRIFWNAW